jgi:hypothetical protein
MMGIFSSVLKQMICLTVITALFSGCSTMVAYSPQASSPNQSIRYTQGVGTLSIKDNDHEIFMYPTFRMQEPTGPTFTIGYANNTNVPVSISTANVKAFFRGTPVPIYTYSEKVAEIQTEKRSKQIALAVIGGLAAGAAAYGASRQTYTTNYSGYVQSGRHFSSFAGSNTVRVYDPTAGMLAGAAVGGVTALSIQQLEYNAQNQEQSAGSILQENTVDPQRMVTGILILKDCCDQFTKLNDTIRFEITVNGKVSVFEFVRMAGNKNPIANSSAGALSIPTPTEPRTSEELSELCESSINCRGDFACNRFNRCFDPALENWEGQKINTQPATSKLLPLINNYKKDNFSLKKYHSDLSRTPIDLCDYADKQNISDGSYCMYLNLRKNSQLDDLPFDAVNKLIAAAKLNHPAAQNDLAHYYAHLPKAKQTAKNDTELRQLIQSSAEAGISNSQVSLGWWQMTGEHGYKKNYQEAYKWNLRGYEQGHSEGANNIGELHEKGLGVPKSNDEAKKWYELAAAMGNKQAASRLILIKSFETKPVSVSQINSTPTSSSLESVENCKYSSDCQGNFACNRFNRCFDPAVENWEGEKK